MSFEKIYSNPEEMCSICTEFLEDDVWAHSEHCCFHGHCIRPWVEKNPSCPLCRQLVDTTTLLGRKVLKDVKTPEPEGNGFRYLIGTIAVLSGCGLYFHFRDRGT